MFRKFFSIIDLWCYKWLSENNSAKKKIRNGKICMTEKIEIINQIAQRNNSRSVVFGTDSWSNYNKTCNSFPCPKTRSKTKQAHIFPVLNYWSALIKINDFHSAEKFILISILPPVFPSEPKATPEKIKYITFGYRIRWWSVDRFGVYAHSIRPWGTRFIPKYQKAVRNLPLLA